MGGLVAFLQAYNQLNEPWRELINHFQLRENAKVKYEQVIANFDPPGLRPEFPLEERLPEPGPRAGPVATTCATPPCSWTARSGRSTSSSSPSPAQHHVAVVGTAGSGKTTLALVLSRLYGYTGTVLLDEAELADAGRRGGRAADRLRRDRVAALHGHGVRQPDLRAPPPAGPGRRRRARWPAADGAEWLDLAAAGAADQDGPGRRGAGGGARGGPGRRPLRARAPVDDRRARAARHRRADPGGPPPGGRAVRATRAERRWSSSSTGSASPTTRPSARTSSSATARCPSWPSIAWPTARTSARSSPRPVCDDDLAAHGLRRSRSPARWSRSSGTSHPTTSCSPTSA